MGSEHRTAFTPAQVLGTMTLCGGLGRNGLSRKCLPARTLPLPPTSSHLRPQASSLQAGQQHGLWRGGPHAGFWGHRVTPADLPAPAGSRVRGPGAVGGLGRTPHGPSLAACPHHSVYFPERQGRAPDPQEGARPEAQKHHGHREQDPGRTAVKALPGQRSPGKGQR